MSTPWALNGNSSTQPGTDFLGTTDESPLVIRTNRRERMRIGTDGSLGFPSPLTIKLDDAERLRIDQANIVIRTPAVDFRGSDTTPPLTLKANGEPRLTLNANGSLSYLMTEGASPSVAMLRVKDRATPLLEITTAGSLNFGPDRLTVAADGKTGVGTSTPRARLHAVDSGGFGEAEDESGILVASRVPLLAQSDTTAFGALNADGRPAFALNIDQNAHTANARGIPTFYDRYDGNWHHGISLRNGKIGMGTHDPQARLHVVNGAIMPAIGNHRSAGIQFLADPAGGGGGEAFIRYHAPSGESTRLVIGIENDADDILALWQHGNERLTIRNGNISINGSVDIGTTASNQTLTVEGGARIRGIVVGANLAGTDYWWDYETLGVTHLAMNLRLQSPNSIIFHAGRSPNGGFPPPTVASIGPSGMHISGNLSTGDYASDVPGIHTWDLVAEGGVYVGPLKSVLGFKFHPVSITRDGEVKIRGNLTVAPGEVKVEGRLTTKFLTVQAMASGQKNFEIPHPLDPEQRRLVHGCVEGPEYAVFYRGEGQLAAGKAVVELPEYFEALTRAGGRTVQVTPICDGDGPISVLAASAVRDGRFDVQAIDQSNSLQRFYWEVTAVRADVEQLVAEPEPTPTDEPTVGGAADS